MGQAKSVMHRRKVPRALGDELNIFHHPKEHIEIVVQTSAPSKRISVCRCWRSAKFPLCDNSHQIMQSQGIKVGPAMVEVRKP